MDLTFFIGSLSGGGAEKVACYLASYLSDKQHHITILTMDDGAPQYQLSDNISIVPLITRDERKGFLYNMILRMRRFRNYLMTTETDGYIVFLPILIILSLFFRRFSKSPMIMAERNMPSQYSSYKRFFLKCFWKKADAWCFQTEEQLNWYPKGMLQLPTCVIPNAINQDINFDNNEVGIKKEIVSAGRLTNQKNQILLIKAFKEISSKNPDYTLVIYGKGPLRDVLSEEIHKLGLENRVILYGHCNDVIEKIKSAEMFVLSSEFEGMPNALMEAMALGLPCISTDCEGGGAKFLIKNNENGILVPRNNVKALAEAMQRLIENKEFASHIGGKAKEIRCRLAPDVIYSQWESFIKNICHDPKTN